MHLPGRSVGGRDEAREAHVVDRACVLCIKYPISVQVKNRLICQIAEPCVSQYLDLLGLEDGLIDEILDTHIFAVGILSDAMV